MALTVLLSIILILNNYHALPQQIFKKLTHGNHIGKETPGAVNGDIEWVPLENYIHSKTSLNKTQVNFNAAQKMFEFHNAFPAYVIQDSVKNNFNGNAKELSIRKRRETRHFFVGRLRGQTQSQYINFGTGNDSGRAEAEYTNEGSRAIVSGTNGMGQAQSQSYGCEDCTGVGMPNQVQTINYGQNAGTNKPQESDGARGWNRNPTHHESNSNVNKNSDTSAGDASGLGPESVSDGDQSGGTRYKITPGRRPTRPCDESAENNRDIHVGGNGSHMDVSTKKPCGYPKSWNQGRVVNTGRINDMKYYAVPSSRNRYPNRSTQHTPNLNRFHNRLPNSDNTFSHRIPPSGYGSSKSDNVGHPGSDTSSRDQTFIHKTTPSLTNNRGITNPYKDSNNGGHVRPSSHAHTGPVSHGYIGPSSHGHVGSNTNGYIEPSNLGNVESSSNGYVGLSNHGYVGPSSSHGYVDPSASHEYVGPSSSHGYVDPSRSYGYVGPSSHGYVGPSSSHGNISPSNHDNVGPSSQGDVEPSGNGYIGPSSYGHIEPNSNSHVRPNGLKHVNANNNGYVGPSSHGHLGPSSNGYVGPSSNAHLGPSSNGYVGPSSHGHIGPSSNGDVGPSSHGHDESSSNARTSSRGHPRPNNHVYVEPGSHGLVEYNNKSESNGKKNINNLEFPVHHTGPSGSGFEEEENLIETPDYGNRGSHLQTSGQGQETSNLYGKKKSVNGAQTRESRPTGHGTQQGSPDQDDAGSQAQTSVQQTVNGTQASASAQGNFAGGLAQSHVSGTYSGSGSFSASAGTDDGRRGAQTQVTGGKKGALSTAQGKGGTGQSQSQVQLLSETGDMISTAQSSGYQQNTQSQLQAGTKGGLADAQANGLGSTSSQAQIGFSPHNVNDQKHTSIPFIGDGTASAQGSTHSGQTQAQMHGAFLHGIKYTGQAQAESNSEIKATEINTSREKEIINHKFRPPSIFSTLPLDDLYNNTESQGQYTFSLTNKPSNNFVNKISPTNYIVDEQKMSQNKINNLNTQYSNFHPNSTFIGSYHYTNKNVSSNSALGNSYNYGTHNTESSSKNITSTGFISTVLPQKHTGIQKVNETSIISNITSSEAHGDDYEVSTDINMPDYNEDYGDYNEEYDEPSNDERFRQTKTVFKQYSNSQKQHIVLDPLENLDAIVYQSTGNYAPDGTILQPGEIIPGSSGIKIPQGFRGHVKSLSYGPNTYTTGKNSQAQSVTLTPGAGRIIYKTPSYPTSTNKVYMGNVNASSKIRRRYQDPAYTFKTGTVLPNIIGISKSQTGYKTSSGRNMAIPFYYRQSRSCGNFARLCKSDQSCMMRYTKAC